LCFCKLYVGFVPTPTPANNNIIGISAKLAKQLSESEYEKYRQKMIKVDDAKEIKELEAGLNKLNIT